MINGIIVLTIIFAFFIYVFIERRREKKFAEEMLNIKINEIREDRLDSDAKSKAIAGNPNKELCSCGFAFKDESNTFREGVHWCNRMLINSSENSIDWASRHAVKEFEK